MPRRLAFSLILPLTLAAQDAPKPAPTPAPKLETEPERTVLTAEQAGTVDALIKSLYGFISGPAGKRDIPKIRALFHLSCHFIITGNKPDGAVVVRVLTVEEFLQRAVPNWEKGFIEHETKRDQFAWGNMASVWTRYESNYGEGMKELMHGINSLQLQWDGTRWWVMNIQFQNEDASTKLPK